MAAARPQNASSQRQHETASRADVYARVTDQIIKAIEAGVDTYTMPWNAPGATSALPRNAMTGKPYRGVNVLALMVEAHTQQYAEANWATYRQLNELGYQVRKGEKSTLGVFWKPLDLNNAGDQDSDHGPDDADAPQGRWVARAFHLFNIAQTEGYRPPELLAPRPGHERIADIERFIAALGSDIHHGGSRACYRSATDQIHMPHFDAFFDPFAYYSTLAHEVTHWTGHASRLNRALKSRFGTESYAFEELIAELGASFLAADLGLSPEPRPENAAYIDNWLSVLKRDTRAIFTAASHAQRAVDYLHDQQRTPAPKPCCGVPSSTTQQSLCL